MATPFVEGRLMRKTFSARIETACARCRRKLDIRVDNELRRGIKRPNIEILLFEPEVDWSRFTKPNIIGDY